ncbi:hypothetical protein GCM10023320_40370 [Pseudonocardia adelaidensis]|uniref:Uncharacterized protein n=1 Tax=Pseudonocardia adelaidensis TaxID=648754 RepID=A0ABP9NLA4_9PSEU
MWRRRVADAPEARAVTSSEGVGERGPALLTAGLAAGADPVMGLTPHSTVAVRLTLGVMAAGMAAMLALMSV